MQKEAEIHASEDAKQKDKIETFNQADTLAYTAEKTLRENKDKIPADLNQEVEKKVQAVRSALQGTNIEALKRATQELNETMQKVGSAVYQQQPPPPPGKEAPPGGEQPSGHDGDETVEGDFREV